VFDAHGIDRLTKWKEFRNTLEVLDDPLQAVVDFWNKAPFVSPYLNPQTPKSWPDPWHLVLDEKLDNLAICLGMLYTLKLTQRFMDSVCEIHMSMLSKDSEHRYFLVIDDKVLNYEYGEILSADCLSEIKTSILLSVKTLP
jgi:hypothetical protein